MSIIDILMMYYKNMNNLKPFCIISIDGRLNKFSKNFPKLNSCVCFSIDSHENFNETELKEKTKDYHNIIIVCGLAGESAGRILLNILDILKDKNCLVVANTPFDFEGKKRRKIANEILEILEIKNINKLIFYSRSFFKKWKEEDLDGFKDIYSFVDVQLIETINKIIKST